MHINMLGLQTHLKFLCDSSSINCVSPKTYLGYGGFHLTMFHLRVVPEKCATNEGPGNYMDSFHKIPRKSQ